jgi:predicted phage-related endonuclease
MVGKVTDNCKASASLIPAIMGYSKWSTPSETLKLVRSHIDGTAEEWNGNEATEWGNRLEGTVVGETCRRLGIKDYNAEIDYAIKHPSLPLECSLDAEGEGAGRIIRTDAANGIFCMGSDEIKLEGKGAIESKVTSMRPEDQPALDRGPLQLQAQMMCGEYHWGAIGVLYEGICLRVFVFEPHEATVKAITDAVLDFDNRLRTDPPRWYDISTSADAALIYADGDIEAPKELGADYANLAREFLLLKASIKDAEEAMGLISVEIQKEMGNHTVATVDVYQVKWPVRHTKAKPETVVPAKEASSARQKSISVKEAR